MFDIALTDAVKDTSTRSGPREDGLVRRRSAPHGRAGRPAPVRRRPGRDLGSISPSRTIPSPGRRACPLAFLGRGRASRPAPVGGALRGGAYAGRGACRPTRCPWRIATRQGRRPGGLRGARLPPTPGRSCWSAPSGGIPARAPCAGLALRGKKLRARGFLERALTGGRGDRLPGLPARPPPDRAREGRHRAAIAGWPDPPLVSVLMPVYDPPPAVLEAAPASLRGQLYPHWELSAPSTTPRPPRRCPPPRQGRRGGSPIRSGAGPRTATSPRRPTMPSPWPAARGAPSSTTTTCSPRTPLYEIARAAREDPALVLVYSDEDKIDGRGRRFEPHFKPDSTGNCSTGRTTSTTSPPCAPTPFGGGRAASPASRAARTTTCSCGSPPGSTPPASVSRRPAGALPLAGGGRAPAPSPTGRSPAPEAARLRAGGGGRRRPLGGPSPSAARRLHPAGPPPPRAPAAVSVVIPDPGPGRPPRGDPSTGSSPPPPTGRWRC